MEKIITLVTDFGMIDPFVASMKGVILEINKEAQIIDVTHQINPFDLHRAAFLVSNYYKFFPEGTIHVLVVDPGVGSDRRALIVKSEKYFFIAPDNGILSYIYNCENIEYSIAIDMEKDCYFKKKVSATFHGRDIFAPVAARLSLGVPPEEMGTCIYDMIKLNLPTVTVLEDQVIGEIIYIDGFGNALTNITENLFRENIGGKFELHFHDIIIDKIARSYSEVPLTGTGAIFSSEGYLEIFSNQGNFAREKDVMIGETVIIQK
ncbi:MAG: S-adenosyl-l-methionine hydroxide adenosyltransferase family protein [bacterium]